MFAVLAATADSNWSDRFVAIGVVATAVISTFTLVHTLLHNRRSSYVGAVTSTRTKWLGEVRDHLAKYVALILEFRTITHKAPRTEELRVQIAQERMLLRLQLAPDNSRVDHEFHTEIERLFRDYASIPLDKIETELSTFVTKGQAFLWNEWMKIKKEAIDGDPYDRLFRSPSP